MIRKIIERFQGSRQDGLKPKKFRDCMEMAKYYGLGVGSIVDIINEDGKREEGWKIENFYDPLALSKVDVKIFRGPEKEKSKLKKESLEKVSIEERVEVILTRGQERKVLYFRDLLNAIQYH